MSFWDSSGLAPLCTKEPRSILAGRLWKQFPQRFASWTAVVEVESALARLNREHRITGDQLIRAEARLVNIETKFQIVEPEPRIIDLARTFPVKFNLKAADCIQLASALVWCKEEPKNKSFVYSDFRLLAAAEDIGFTVHDLS